MKLLVIILILIVVAVAMVWLRANRQDSGRAEPREGHLEGDTTPPPTTFDLHTDTPSTSAGLASGGGVHDVPEEPGSDFAWEPEVTGTDKPKAPDDPPAPGSRPGA